MLFLNNVLIWLNLINIIKSWIPLETAGHSLKKLTIICVTLLSLLTKVIMQGAERP